MGCGLGLLSWRRYVPIPTSRPNIKKDPSTSQPLLKHRTPSNHLSSLTFSFLSSSRANSSLPTLFPSILINCEHAFFSGTAQGLWHRKFCFPTPPKQFTPPWKLSEGRGRHSETRCDRKALITHHPLYVELKMLTSQCWT